MSHRFSVGSTDTRSFYIYMRCEPLMPGQISQYFCYISQSSVFINTNKCKYCLQQELFKPEDEQILLTVLKMGGVTSVLEFLKIRGM